MRGVGGWCTRSWGQAEPEVRELADRPPGGRAGAQALSSCLTTGLRPLWLGFPEAAELPAARCLLGPAPPPPQAK